MQLEGQRVAQKVLRDASCSCDIHAGPAVHKDLLFSLHASWTSVSVSKQSLGEPCGSVGDLFSLLYRGSAVHGTWWGDRASARSTGALDKAGQASWPRSGGDGPGCPHLQAPGPLGSASSGLSLSSQWWLVSTSLEVSPRPLFLVTLEAKTSHENARVKSTTLQLTLQSNL